MNNTKPCYALWRIWDENRKELLMIYAKKKDADNRAKALAQLVGMPCKVEEVTYVKWLSNS